MGRARKEALGAGFDRRIKLEFHDAASISEMARFETDVLTHPNNLAASMDMPGQLVDLIRRRRYDGCEPASNQTDERSLPCQSVPTAGEATGSGLATDNSDQNSASRSRFRSQARGRT